MELSANEYKGSLSQREAFLVRSLAEKQKALFTIEDASQLIGPGAKKVLHRLASPA